MAVVEALDDDANPMEDIDDDHPENVYPDAGTALIEKVPPALTHTLDPAAGEMVPPAVGLEAMETWNCSAKLIVAEVWVGTLIEPPVGEGEY